MQIWNNLKLIIILALIAMFGIIMMLIVDGIYDEILLFITCIPILIGCYRAYFLYQKK